MSKMRAKQKKTTAKASTAKASMTKTSTALDAVTQEVERAFAQRDGRVIARERDVLLYQLKAAEDHLAGLAASTAAVKSEKATIEAKVAGLTRVLGKR